MACKRPASSALPSSSSSPQLKRSVQAASAGATKHPSFKRPAAAASALSACCALGATPATAAAETTSSSAAETSSTALTPAPLATPTTTATTVNFNSAIPSIDFGGGPKFLRRRAFAACSFEEEKSLVLEKAKYMSEGKQLGYPVWQAWRSELDKASPELRDDPAVMLVVNPLDGLRIASDRLRSSRDFISRAVKADGRAIDHASPDLQRDADILRDALKTHGWALLDFGNEELRRQKDAVLDAVKNCGHALACASPELRSDEEVVRAAVRNNGYALRYASEVFRNCKSVVLDAVCTFGKALKFAHVDLGGDNEVVLEAVQNDPEALKFAAEALRSDRQIVGIALAGAEEISEAAEYKLYALPEDANMPSVVWDCVGRAWKQDKDNLLWAIRSMDESLAERCHQRALRYMEDILPSWDGVKEASRSALAVAGEAAPVLTVTLTQESTNEAGEGSSCSNSYLCEVCLMSGSSFSFCFGASHSITSGQTPSVPSLDPTVDDLAQSVRAKLCDHVKADVSDHIFVNFAVGEGEYLPVTPWDCNRPLSDFVRHT